MRHAVLADSGPLYAAVDASDQFHRRARTELDRLNNDGLAVIVIYPVLLECYTLVLRHLGTVAAHDWSSEVRQSAVLVNPVPDDYLQALIAAGRYPDQPLTLVDATVATVSDRLSAPVWTYDHHFDIMRTAVWR